MGDEVERRAVTGESPLAPVLPSHVSALSYDRKRVLSENNIETLDHGDSDFSFFLLGCQEAGFWVDLVWVAVVPCCLALFPPSCPERDSHAYFWTIDWRPEKPFGKTSATSSPPRPDWARLARGVALPWRWCDAAKLVVSKPWN